MFCVFSDHENEGEDECSIGQSIVVRSEVKNQTEACGEGSQEDAHWERWVFYNDLPSPSCS